MPVTIKDVARMAGVSISTVSRVINESKPVSSNIRDRVFKVIEETGYVPNPVARSLVMKKSQLLGVLVPGTSKYSVGDFVNGVEEIARMYEYDTILCNTYCDSEKEEEYVDLLRSKQVAGIILITEKLNEDIDKKLKKAGIPTVYYTLGTEKIENINSVDIDRALAISELIEKLKSSKGKIIYLRPTKSESDCKEKSKEKLLKEAMKISNVSNDKLKIVYGANNVDETYKLLEKTLKNEKNVNALLSSGDEVTLGSIYYLQDKNIKIPEDFKIAQIYDTKITRLARPEITSILLPHYDLGAICARMIVKEIENKENQSYIQKYNEMILPHTVMERKSTNK